MITDDAALTQTVEQLGRAYQALAALRAEMLPRNPSWFALMAESALEQIRQLEREIQEYAGVSVAEASAINGTTDQTSAENVETHVGDLRGIDLDNLVLTLRNADRVEEIRCTFEEHLLEIAKEALDRRVKVTGIRRTAEGRRTHAALRAVGLEIIEEQNTESQTAPTVADMPC